MSIESIVTDLAAIAAVKKIVADAEAAKKVELQAELTRGTVYAYADDDKSVQLGYASVPKPTQPKPTVEIEDEARVLPWALDMFGESVASFQLTEQGRKSVIEYALADHMHAGAPAEYDGVEGVRVRVPEARPSTPRFTPEKNVVELVQGMVRSGRLSLSTILELDGGAA
ncbi:hypothetical protein [Rhodococcus sp. BE178]|uniref:hypothetical protein n=1 Tax=Rhodococcus sp. BE178 TaxID=2817737 RepID=UPI003D1BA022